MGATTLGVPRMKELLSYSKNIKTPKMFIYLTEENMQNRDLANKIASHIKYTTIGHLRKRIDVFYDPNPTKKGGFMEKDNVYNIFYSFNPNKNSCQGDIKTLPWLMRIELDREKLLNKEVTLLDIKTKFCNNWEKRYVDLKALKKEERVILEKVSQCAVLTNTDNDAIPIVHIRFDMTNFDTTTIVSFMDMIVDKFKIKGLSSISEAQPNEERIISFNNANEEKEIKTNNIIYTNGINLYDIRYIHGIDLTRTISNDIQSVLDTFGIEAARTILLKEIVLTFKSAGNNLNFQHLSILADIMTNNGTITSIDRHGLNRLDTDPLSRASFEKTVDQLLTSAVFGETDYMKSVSSRIMAGLVIKGGTGICDIILDTNMIEKSEQQEDIGEKYKKTYTDISSNVVMDDVIKKENDDIFIPI